MQFNPTNISNLSHDDVQILNRMQTEATQESTLTDVMLRPSNVTILNNGTPQKFVEPIVVEETLSLSDKEKEMIIKSLQKYKGKRKLAASELGISERTLYRKINEYGINE